MKKGLHEFLCSSPSALVALSLDDLGDELTAKIQGIAMRAFAVLGCRDYARVDMRLDAKGNPYILEVNPNPDLADGCAFAQCVRASGRTYAQAIQEIVGYGLLVPAQQYVGRFLATFKDYPPSQKPGSFSIDGALEALQRTAGGN